MANDFERRLKGVEDREAILYEYIDELRTNSVKLDRQHDEMLQRMTENEERIRQNEQMMGRLVETQGMLIRIMNRMDQKLDDLGKHGTNGIS